MWIVENTDGSLSQHSDLKWVGPHVRKASLPRMLDFRKERWDWSSSTIVANNEGLEKQIDQTHGHENIEKAHILKVLEAQDFKAGRSIDDGLLAAEAEIVGCSLEDLVNTVLSKHDEFKAKELDRRRAKVWLRNDQLTTP